jgi:hypothetical protein
MTCRINQIFLFILHGDLESEIFTLDYIGCPVEPLVAILAPRPDRAMVFAIIRN